MAWFRLHTSVINNPKIQKLPGEAVKAWINMLCLAKEGDGIIPKLDGLAWSLRKSEQQVEKLLCDLVGLIDRNEDGTFSPHDWNDHQYKSDVSTDRVKAFRSRSRNATETFRETSVMNIGNGGETPRARSEQNRAETEQKQSRETTINGLTPDEFDEAWERHRKHSNRESRDMVVRMLIGLNGRFDVAKFRDRHPRYCRHWESESWKDFGAALTLWGWVENGMPEPQPKAANKPAPTGAAARAAARMGDD